MSNATHWQVDPKEAVALQKRLRDQVLLEDDFGEIRTVAGIDCAFPEHGAVARCAVVLLSFPALAVIEEVVAHLPVTFPYIPGLLAFREGPAIEAALDQLSEPPDLLLFDGHGYAHPRRLGIASHVAVLRDVPAIGCAKSILTGHYDEPGPNPGDRSPLLAGDGELLGYALRTKLRTKPMIISPGHRISPATAADLAMRCVRGYRLPEPTRLADKLSKASGM